MSAGKPQRCAIYTRVSSDQGLEQDFNSLHAQREAAEAYVKSQAHEGWRLHRERYDDGGFSGGSMERPALQKLLVEVAARRLDVIVVYKVDRLTRSLADFAKLVELFDAHGVSFVSVTQSFNTTTSMGRLTLNVLLSFAQFEREVTGERIRDKIAASKKKGLWMGGVVPLGYRVEQRKLLVDEVEAETVRLIFRRYLELGSLSALQADLRQRNIRRRLRIPASGNGAGDIAFTNGPLAHMLKNRMYLGDINHRVVLRSGQAEVSWTDPGCPGEADSRDDEQRRRVVVVPFTVTPHKHRREIMLPADGQHVRPIRAGEQQNLVRSIALGRAWLAQIVAGATASGIATREQRTERMVRMMLSLAFLDPKLVRAVLQGSLPRGTSVRRLIDAPACWHEQWQVLGLTRPS